MIREKNIKNTCFVFLIVLCAVIFVGCSSTKSNPGSNITVPKSNRFAAIDGFSIQGNLSFISSEIGADGFSSDNGYYRMIPQKDASNVLSFIDYATAQETVVCSRPECKHKDDSCTAWFPYGGGMMLPISVGNKLVLVCGGNTEYFDVVGNAAAARIEVMEPNGSDRKQAYIFDKSTSIGTGFGTNQNSFAKDEKNLYFVADNYQNTEDKINTKRLLCAYDTQSESMFLLQEIDSNTRIVGAFEDKLVLENAPQANIINTDAQSIQCSISVLSLFDLTQQEIGTRPYLAQGRFENNDYYFLTEEGSLQVLNLHNGEQKIINKTVFSSDVMQKPHRIEGIQNNNLFISFETPRDETTENGQTISYIDRILYAIDLQTGTAKEIPYYYDGEMGKLPAKIVSSFENQYLIISSEEAISVRLQISKGNFIDYIYPKVQYSLQTKEDFWNGIQKTQPITEIS